MIINLLQYIYYYLVFYLSATQTIVKIQILILHFLLMACRPQQHIYHKALKGRVF